MLEDITVMGYIRTVLCLCFHSAERRRIGLPLQPFFFLIPSRPLLYHDNIGETPTISNSMTVERRLLLEMRALGDICQTQPEGLRPLVAEIFAMIYAK